MSDPLVIPDMPPTSDDPNAIDRILEYIFNLRTEYDDLTDTSLIANGIQTDPTITGDGTVGSPLSAIGAHRYTVEDDETFTIPANHQFDILGRFEVNGGRLEIEGRMEVG